MMKPEALREEKKQLEAKLRQIKASIIRCLEQGRYLGLDQRVRQVQKNYRLQERI